MVSNTQTNHPTTLHPIPNHIRTSIANTTRNSTNQSNTTRNRPTPNTNTHHQHNQRLIKLHTSSHGLSGKKIPPLLEHNRSTNHNQIRTNTILQSLRQTRTQPTTQLLGQTTRKTIRDHYRGIRLESKHITTTTMATHTRRLQQPNRLNRRTP